MKLAYMGMGGIYKFVLFKGFKELGVGGIIKTKFFYSNAKEAFLSFSLGVFQRELKNSWDII